VPRWLSAGLIACACLAGGAAAFALPARAAASVLPPPLSVKTEAVESTSKTAAVVEGSVTGASPSAEFLLAYALASSDWCKSNGAEGPKERTQSKPLEQEEVQPELTGLEEGTKYCVELEAREGIRSAHGAQLEFTAGAPSFGEELDAEAISPSTAVLAAEVELAGQGAEFRVLYGAAESEWCESKGSEAQAEHETAPQKVSAEEASGEYVEAELADLMPGASYCARLALTNETAEAQSAQEEFVSGAPFAAAVEAQAKSSEVEVVEGFISPASQATSYRLDYEKASSTWCARGGAEGEHLETSAKQVGSSEESLQPVTVEVEGLKPGEGYCAALVAKNNSASSRVLTPIEFTAGLASVIALEAVPISPEAAEVTATLNLAGQPTSYELTQAKAGEPQCHPAQVPPVRTGSQRLARIHLPRTGLERAQRTLSPTLPGAALALPFAEGELPGTEGDSMVTLEIANLHPGSEYCVQLRVENESGKTSPAEVEEDEAFFVAGAPTARTQEQVTSTQTTALVKGEVQTAEQETSYWLQYGLASSQWCLTEGAAGSPQKTEPLTLPAGSKGFEQVQAEPTTGLSAGLEYCASFAAENESGEAAQAQAAYFTTRAPAFSPSASTAPVTKIGTSSATIEGTVNPGNTQTTYHAAYGLESSQWCVSGGAPGALPEHESMAATLAAEDGEAHTVAVEVSALSAASEYCAAIIASNSVGGSELLATVSFTTASSSGSSPQEGQEGSGGVLGEEARKEPEGEAKAQVGSQAVVGTVSGTVTVKLKGTSLYAPLGPGTLISDGSEIEATNGRVRLTVSLPDGKTQTAEAFGGRFLIEQEANGFTKLVLTLALTGCPRQALPKGSASAASILRSQPLHRHLWVTEKGGKWGTNGRFVSTSVEGTTWLTTDECKRSIVFLKEGRLKVRNLVTKKTKLLTAGHSYTAKDPRKRNHKRSHRR
jgi:hypothetical protein